VTGIDLFYDDRVLGHDTGAGLFDTEEGAGLLAVPELHPENVERVLNMKAVLERGPLAPRLRWHAGRLAATEELERVHERDYVRAVQDACEHGGRFTKTTFVGPGSWEALLAAAGTCLEAADAVLDSRAQIAYALVRPPGHHAQPAQADGYCFIAHEALVVERARARGVERVAVLDWDVHHGNGTQECFYHRAEVLTVSLHMRHGRWGQSHPQSGAADEIGVGDGEGFNVNLELGIGAGDATYAAAFDEVVVPIVRQFGPDLLVGASGQDASGFDPNGRQNLSMEGFRRIGATVAALADELCDGRMVLVQEGGYGRTYSAYCLHATLEGILGVVEPLLPDPLAYVPDDPTRGRAGMEDTRAALTRFWDL
jgi:acetoin utilization deacetylase AcuC-like enzyme